MINKDKKLSNEMKKRWAKCGSLDDRMSAIKNSFSRFHEDVDQFFDMRRESFEASISFLLDSSDVYFFEWEAAVDRFLALLHADLQKSFANFEKGIDQCFTKCDDAIAEACNALDPHDDLENTHD